MKLEAMQIELAKTEKKRQQLLAKIEGEQQKRLKALPALVGLKSIDELFMALATHASSHLKLELLAKVTAPTGKGQKSIARGAKSAAARPRERFDEALRARVRAAMQAGDKTMAQIAAEYGPSIHSLRIWKRSWGMTRALKRAKPR